MILQFSPYVIPLFFGGLLSVYIASAAWKRTHIAGHREFTFVMVAIALWLIGYGLEISILLPPIIRQFWSFFVYVGVSTLPIWWLFFLLEHSRRQQLIPPLLRKLMFIIPICTLTLIWVRPELMWKSAELITVFGVKLYKNQHGEWFNTIHLPYSYGIYLVDTILLSEIAIKSPKLDQQRTQIVILAALAPWVSNALFLLGFKPLSEFDLTPFAVAATGIAMAWAVFEFSFLDISPIAYKTVFDTLPDSIIMVNLDGRVAAFNPAMADLLSRTGRSIRSKLLFDLIPQEWWQLLADSHLERELDLEVQRIVENKRQYLTMYAAPIYDTRHRLIGRLIRWRDITQNREAELALSRERTTLAERVGERTAELRHANKELEHASRLKDEFLASMSHELRTPLNAIIGTTEALTEGIYGDLNDAQEKSLGRIGESAQHLLSLISDILDVSKIEAGEFQLQIEELRVETVCHSSLNFIKTAATQKQIKIISTINIVMPIIRGDERRIKQILINLLGNAVKFTPTGGKVGLGVFEDMTRKQTHFVVWDTGIGIEEEDLNKLFKPFVQLDSRLNRQHEGTGLGLALSQRLATLHGGSIRAHSEIGKGSRFTLTLPWGMNYPIQQTTQTGRNNIQLPVN